jgi:hypothetical protein
MCLDLDGLKKEYASSEFNLHNCRNLSGLVSVFKLSGGWRSGAAAPGPFSGAVHDTAVLDQHIVRESFNYMFELGAVTGHI